MSDEPLDEIWPFIPDTPCAPGQTILEAMRHYNMSEADCAEAMGLPADCVRGLINNFVRITPDLAIRLARALGLPPSFWRRFQANYDADRARCATQQGPPCPNCGSTDSGPGIYLGYLRRVPGDDVRICNDCSMLFYVPPPLCPPKGDLQ